MVGERGEDEGKGRWREGVKEGRWERERGREKSRGGGSGERQTVGGRD